LHLSNFVDKYCYCDPAWYCVHDHFHKSG